MPKNSTAIGIDLGTTNSCVGVVRNGRVEIIANDKGHRTTPSYVAFSESEWLIGDAAKKKAASNPQNTIYDVKRLIGRKFNDPDVQRLINQWPFEVIDHNDAPMISVTYNNEKKKFTPEQISSMILMKMKEVAEEFTGSVVKDAVITVPAYFNDSQRQATIDAGTIAGLNVLKIINEPTAAAIAYCVDKNEKKDHNILVFDLGGGTFDVVVLNANNYVFDILAVSGDTFLGGSDVDNILVQHFSKEFEKKYEIDISGDHKALAKLRKACEKIKINLSSSLMQTIQIESLSEGQDFSSTISRVRFEELCSDLFKNTLNPVEAVLLEANLDKSEIDEIILAGGSTRVPKIQKLLESMFEGKKLNKTINPDEAVAYGAALHAAILSGCSSIDEIFLKDVTPMSLGTEVLGNEVSRMIKKNTKIPTETKKLYTTAVENQECVQIKVYEGERNLSANNNLLGDFLLDNIQQARAGIPIIEVTFAVDENGILKVSARDESTGCQKSIRITDNKGRLNQEEKKEMMVGVEELREQNRKIKENMGARSHLEEYCIETKCKANEKQSNNEIHLEDYYQICTACDDILHWLHDNQYATKNEIKEKKERLKTLYSVILTIIYSKSDSKIKSDSKCSIC